MDLAFCQRISHAVTNATTATGSCITTGAADDPLHILSTLYDAARS